MKMKPNTRQDKVRLAAERAAWARGELSYLFNKAQHKIYKKLTKRPKGQKLFVANVARQTGKTFLASCLAISQALKEPNSPNPNTCLLYTSPSPRDRQKSRMPSSA